jgi:hypothetical protein
MRESSWADGYAQFVASSAPMMALLQTRESIGLDCLFDDDLGQLGLNLAA